MMQLPGLVAFGPSWELALATLSAAMSSQIGRVRTLKSNHQVIKKELGAKLLRIGAWHWAVNLPPLSCRRSRPPAEEIFFAVLSNVCYIKVCTYTNKYTVREIPTPIPLMTLRYTCRHINYIYIVYAKNIKYICHQPCFLRALWKELAPSYQRIRAIWSGETSSASKPGEKL